jgi:CDP-diglyceride synthetase
MTRVVSGLALAGGTFALVWYGSAAVLLGVTMLVCVAAFGEYRTIVRGLGIDVPLIPTLPATLAALVLVPYPVTSPALVIACSLVVIAAAEMRRHRHPRSPHLTSPPPTSPHLHISTSPDVLPVFASLLPIVYLGLPLGALVGLHVGGGGSAVLILIATVAVSDTSQYYAGRLLGRRPLAPRLSPKKTVEGALGGLVVAPLFMWAAGRWLIPEASWTLLPMGVGLVGAGIAGDLFESMLKRAAHLKDSSTVIPGHGGVLDRIDALLFAAPVFLLYLQWVRVS